MSRSCNDANEEKIAPRRWVSEQDEQNRGT